MTVALIIGDRRDEHVRAVVNAVGDAEPLVLDVTSLQHARYTLCDGVFTVTVDGRSNRFGEEPARGWLRRLVPPQWQRGVDVESHDAAVGAAWVSLMTAVIRTTSRLEWLTDFDRLFIAESKLLQRQVAANASVPTPETIVTDDPAVAAARVGEPFVLKPLGPGHFFDGDEAYAVFATSVTATGEPASLMGTAPFLAQKQLPPSRHLRVPVVGDQCWAAAIDATGYPLDWRSSAQAHQAWRHLPVPDEVARGAIAVTAALGLGYACQDWMDTPEGFFLLDVNPAGQWLFLPPPVSQPVTEAIARWLKGQP